MDIHELEARVQALEDQEAIKTAKARYFNSIDQQDWEKLASCFCSDSVWESARRNVKVEGGAAIVKFIRNIEEGAHIVNGHHGHNFEIELLSATEARATCELYHYRDDKQLGERKISGAFYVDDYVKVDGVWKIKHTRVQPLFLNVSKL